MPRYKAPAPTPVDKTPHRADEDKLSVVDGAYQPHSESGRWKCLQKITNDMTFGEWTKLCAKDGFSTDFCYKSIKKHMEKDTPAFILNETPREKKEKKASKKKDKAAA